MKLIIHDVGDDYEHLGVHSKRTRRSVYVVNDNGREIARFSIYNLNRPISAYPEEIEIAKRFMASESDAARAAQLESEKRAVEFQRDVLRNERDEARKQLEQARKWARVWKSAAKWRRLGAAIIFH